MDPSARRDRRVAVLVIVPLALFVAVFVLVPTAAVLRRTLSLDGDLGAGALHRAATAVERAWFVDAIAVCFVSAVLGALIGLLLALAVVRQRRPRWLHPALASWAHTGSGIGGVPLAFAFVATIGIQGALTRVLAGVGLGPGADAPGSFWPLVVVYLYFQVPLMLLIMLPVAASVPRTWREAAAVLGASATDYWRAVGAPVLAPAALGGAVLLFVTAFTAHATARVLDADGRLSTARIGPSIHGDVAAEELGLATVAWVVALLACGLLVSTVLQRRTLRWTTR